MKNTIFVILAMLVFVPVLMAGVLDIAGSFIESNWKALTGTLALLAGGYAIPVVRIFARTLIAAIVKAIFSEEILKLAFFKVAQKYVDSTESDFDDKLLDKIKENMS